jgi:hypothetical protein
MRSGAGFAPTRRPSSRSQEPPLSFGYAAVQTLQPEDRYGRLFAAYAGVFLIGAVLWGWAIDGKEPDRFDWIGAATVLFGAIVILWGRRIFASRVRPRSRAAGC